MIPYFVARGEIRRLDAAARTALRGDFVELSDGVTHYELKGPPGGELVLLIPGLTIPLFYWDALTARLHQHGFRTLAYSAYGRGYSDRLRSAYDSALFVRQVTELTRALGLLEARHVVAVSMGALVAMHLARQDPAHTRTLTLIGPAGLERRPPPLVRLLRIDVLAVPFGRHFGQRLLRSHIAHEVRSAEHAAALGSMVSDAYAYEGSIHALFATVQAYPLTGQQELYRRIGHSGIPVHLLWGGGDRVTPMAHFNEARALLRPAQSFVFDDCGHMPPFEQPDAVAERMLRFFSHPSTARRLGSRGA